MPDTEAGGSVSMAEAEDPPTIGEAVDEAIDGALAHNSSALYAHATELVDRLEKYRRMKERHGNRAVRSRNEREKQLEKQANLFDETIEAAIELADKITERDQEAAERDQLLVQRSQLITELTQHVRLLEGSRATAIACNRHLQSVCNEYKEQRDLWIRKADFLICNPGKTTNWVD